MSQHRVRKSLAGNHRRDVVDQCGSGGFAGGQHASVVHVRQRAERTSHQRPSYFCGWKNAHDAAILLGRVVVAAMTEAPLDHLAPAPLVITVRLRLRRYEHVPGFRGHVGRDEDRRGSAG